MLTKTLGARYPNATRLLITADGGGSNGSRVRLWKCELQKLANELGLDIVVSHLPPGTSKWNKIEHRLFSFWSRYQRAPHRGRGFAFARDKNLAAYTAIAVEIEVEPVTGRVRLIRAVATTDSGQAVNPDGIRNQIEGGIVESASWTLFEAAAFDRTDNRMVRRGPMSCPNALPKPCAPRVRLVGRTPCSIASS